jgi:plasmid stabilization system protein ParE
MSGYVVTPEASRDLFQIWLYIAEHSEDNADRVEREFYELFASLSEQPGQGHVRPDYTKADVLFFPMYSYLIAYRPNTDPLQIIAIIHGNRRIRKILQQRNAGTVK